MSRADGADLTLAQASMRAEAVDDTLPRVAAAGRLASLDAEAATALAVDYRLMSPHTNCVLVHQRAEADKAVEDAELHRVEGMLAAGWGGAGSVMRESERGIAMPMAAMPAAAGAPMLKRKRAAGPGFLPDAQAELASDASDAFKLAAAPHGLPSRLAGLAREIGAHLWQRSDLQGLMAYCRARGLLQAVGDAIDEVVALGVSDAQAWGLLVRWLDAQASSDVFSAAPAALRLRIQRLAADVIGQANAIFARRLVAEAA